MANAFAAKPEVTLQLDKPRVWKWGYHAMCSLEKKLGKKAVRQMDWNDAGFHDLLLLLWAGLVRHEPTLTEEEVADMLDSVDANEVFQQMVAALNKSAGESVAKEAEEKKEQTAATSQQT